MIRLLFIFLIFITSWSAAQERQTRNLIVVTLDGYRWQEVFKGADSAILFNEKFVSDKKVIDEFWHPSLSVRREKLMPFFWQTIGKQGQLYGNRTYKNKVNCSNPFLFSYPGYSEMLTGFVDHEVRSNDHVENPNATVFDFIQQQPGYKGEVAVFATWEVMPAIVREETDTIPVNAGQEKAEGNISEQEKMLNELQQLLPSPHGARYDAFTFFYAFEYLKRERPKVMFIALDETDAHAHRGRYDDYLRSAHKADKMIAKLWKWLQSQDDYRNKTTLLITTDHGRGKGARKSWQEHRVLAFGSGQVWIAAIGPDTPAQGELTFREQYYQKQIAKTAAAFLGLEYCNRKPVGEVIRDMFRVEPGPAPLEPEDLSSIKAE